MMTVVRSHRMERLADALCDLLRTAASPDPLAPEWIVIPTAGMERHVAMRVAQTLGVAANLRFLFLEEAIRMALSAVLDDEEPARDAFQADRLAWTLLDVVWDIVEREGFSPLAAYLGGPRTPSVTRREVALARRLAEVFDRYVVHRPERVLGWDQGEEAGDWQAELWREVRKRVPGSHLAERVGHCLRALEGPARDLDGLPPRLFLFGISTLPAAHLRLFHALSRHLDVHMFVCVPSREWFGDARTPAEAARAARRTSERVALLTLDDVHPLLRAFGRLSRDFQDALAGEFSADREEDLFDDPPSPRTMLHLLQADLLAARLPDVPHAIPRGDRSIQIHACHGPMRQVEVLRDVLLDLFDADPTLEPRDVLVMTPDIEAYAPLIEAVFGEGEEGSGLPRIPFQIADRSLARENAAADAVVRVLDLAAGRFPASGVLDLLTVPPVARRFGMTATDQERARDFVRAAGIRFGLDADHRAEHGLPRTDEHTWRFGLDRLLLGAAMDSGGGTRIFHDVAPCDAAVCGVETLRRFVAFCEEVLDLVRRARAPRPLSEWVSFTDQVLARLISSEEEDAALAVEARLAARRLLERAGGSPSRPLDLDAWRFVWQAASGERRGPRAFFRGGVTFAAMVPLRNIPFRVIALMGLDDRAFPRPRSALSFDRTAFEPRRGDRTPRDEDLQTFLEALLSARESLIVTYTGQGIRDHQPIPPAVPVGQLIDAIRSSFRIEGEPDAAAAITVRHPLQPFSPKNYCPPHRSHDTRFEAAARALVRGERIEARPRFEGPLSRPEGVTVVSIRGLAAFLEHPVRHLVRTLGFRPRVEADVVEDREVVSLDLLQQYEVGEAILQQAGLESKPDMAALLRRLRRLGALPPGGLSQVEFDALWGEARPILDRARALFVGPAQERAVEVEVEGTRIVGTLDRLYPGGLGVVTYSKQVPKRLVRLWVHHLVATATFSDYPGTATLITREDTHALGPLAQDAEAARARALEHLRDLLDLYRLGQGVPLPFFPIASWTFVEKGGVADPDAALRQVLKRWNDDERGGERFDPDIRFVFGDVPSPEEARAPGAPSFTALAVRVLQPLREVLR